MYFKYVFQILHNTVCRWFVVCLVFWLLSEREITATIDGFAEVVGCWEVTICPTSTKDTPFFALTCWTSFSKIHLISRVSP